MLVIFCVSPCDSIISSSGSVIGNRALCAGSVAGQHCCSSGGFCADYVKFASPSCVCFISFGFLLATICVWVWMVCSLHSVTTGSRDRANVSLIIIITGKKIDGEMSKRLGGIIGCKQSGLC